MVSFRVPIMRLGVATPDEFLGDVMSDLVARQARILGVERAGDRRIVVAWVPRTELYHYADDLDHMTRGLASYQAAFSHYQAEGDDPDDWAGVPSPLKPRPPTRSATAAAEPPPDDSAPLG
jgi:translation elongation factor EF-G